MQRYSPRLTRMPPRSAGFTLTELLIVVTIIAILAGLITAAAVNALNAAKRTRISAEVKQIGQAIEDFKNDMGAYPPNGVNNNQTDAPPVSDFVRMFKKMFPRHQEPRDLIEGLAGNPNAAFAIDGGLSATEALYFWLGGFSSDEKYPISGPGGPSFSLETGRGEIVEDRNQRFGFDITDLGPRNESGEFNGRYVEYEVNVNGVVEERRINLWQYYPEGSDQPLVYFDVSRYKPVDYDPPVAVRTAPGVYDQGQQVDIYALKKIREGVAQQQDHQDIEFANTGKFQILHAGLDDTWGDWRTMSIATPLPELGPLYPIGPFIGDVADTLTNFTTGTVADAAE